MFTGLVQALAHLHSLAPRTAEAATLRLRLDAPLPGRPLEIGESIAVNGICLTLTAAPSPLDLSFDILRETLARTALAHKTPGALLNLERALRVGDPLGGHLVTGHVDGTARLLAATPAGPDIALRLRLVPDRAPDIRPYLLPKGSIALDGTSLTLAEVDNDTFAVHLIPHTRTQTALHALRPGDLLNVEADLLAKAAAGALRASSAATGDAPPTPAITWQRLHDAGFC